MWCWDLNPDFTSAGTHPLSRTKAGLVLKTGLTRTPSNPPSSTTQVAGIRGVKHHTSGLIKAFEDLHEFHAHLFHGV